MEQFNAYVEDKAERFIEELKEFCRQPSISTQNVGLEEMAELVRARLEKLEAEVRLIPVDDGPPVVFAELGQGERTLLIYNHYDVQPPDPLEEWESPPFEPTIREGKFYARGAADNKGNLLARIQAIEAYRAAFGELPLRIKFAVEGGEEVGSPHLAQFAQENRDLLAADGCLWECGGKDEAERFVLYLGLKGIAYLELRARGAQSDLHSSLATIVPNPAWRLVWALSTLKDEDDHITIDGFMDHVAEPTQVEMDILEAIPFEEEKIKENFGIPEFIRGLSGVEALKKHLYEPTCTICGFRSGYIEEGSKTVLPSTATAKLDFRLVPNLTPELVGQLLRQHLDRRGFEDIEIAFGVGEHSARAPLDAPIVQAAISAAEAVYSQPPVIYPTMAGSGPMYPLSEALGIPAVLAGIGYPGANVHAPNENIRLADYFEGIKFVGELIRRFGSRGS
ncbi:MAG: M20/M25/M40 family metallo-hydrolase [Anaerolineales bacterium]|nr:M20/M25/M40 family metallo-hydrolase [Anaerolineales bacterium]